MEFYAPIEISDIEKKGAFSEQLYPVQEKYP